MWCIEICFYVSGGCVSYKKSCIAIKPKEHLGLSFETFSIQASEKTWNEQPLSHCGNDSFFFSTTESLRQGVRQVSAGFAERRKWVGGGVGPFNKKEHSRREGLICISDSIQKILISIFWTCWHEKFPSLPAPTPFRNFILAYICQTFDVPPVYLALER